MTTVIPKPKSTHLQATFGEIDETILSKLVDKSMNELWKQGSKRYGATELVLWKQLKEMGISERTAAIAKSITLNINLEALEHQIKLSERRAIYQEEQKYFIRAGATLDLMIWMYPSFSTRDFTDLRTLCGMSARPGRPQSVRNKTLICAIQASWRELRANQPPRHNLAGSFKTLMKEFTDINAHALFGVIRSENNGQEQVK